MLKVNRRIAIPLAEFTYTFARSGGPGGQNVNKVNSKATLRWPITSSPSLPEDVRQRFLATFRTRITQDGDLVLSSQRYRDQGRNVQDCLDKLREMLLSVATPPKIRRETKPTRGSRERRLQEKKSLGQKKERRRTIRPDD
ncbi:MAG: alternative ribosome rescue aminoacyl-tRNA hydrolase ArfB [Pirellulaceae bacterium]|nr:aminoacyl-tRNA hydrolase [Planctomycetales bacterium]